MVPASKIPKKGIRVLATLLIEQSPGDGSRLPQAGRCKPPRAFLDITISQSIPVSSRSAKTPFRLGKAKRHRDGLTLFRLRAPGTFGF
jgi:hypothetical protein